MTRRTLPTLLLAALIPCLLSSHKHVSAQKRFQTEAMLARVLLKYRGLKSLSQNVRGKMTITADGVKIPVDFVTVVQMAQPDRFRIETTARFLGQEKKGLVISDGTTVWEYDPDSKEYSEKSADGLAKNESEFNDWIMDRAGTDMTLALFLEAAGGKVFGLPLSAAKAIQVKNYPTVKMGGQLHYRIPVPINKVDAEGNKGSATLFVDTKEMLVRRLQFAIVPASQKDSPRNMSVSIVITYDRVTQNSPLTANTFTFAPPEGAKKAEQVKAVFNRVFGDQ